MSNIIIRDSVVIGDIGKDSKTLDEIIEKIPKQIDSNEKEDKIRTPYLNITKEECDLLIDRIKTLWTHEELVNLVDDFVIGLPYFENWQIENAIFICDKVEADVVK